MLLIIPRKLAVAGTRTAWSAKPGRPAADPRTIAAQDSPTNVLTAEHDPTGQRYLGRLPDGLARYAAGIVLKRSAVHVRHNRPQSPEAIHRLACRVGSEAIARYMLAFQE